MDAQALIEAGYTQNNSGQWQKLTSTTTVKREDGTTEEVKGYIPSYRSYAEPTIDTNPESANVPSRAQQIYLEMQRKESAKKAEEIRKAQAKEEMRLMGRYEARQHVAEHGLNNKLTLQEQRQMHAITSKHRANREEQRQKQVEERRRFGDSAKQDEIVRILVELPDDKWAQIEAARLARKGGGS